MDQQPKLRDDRYILNVVLPRWQYDAFEFVETTLVDPLSQQPLPTVEACWIRWAYEGLNVSVFIELNVPTWKSVTSGGSQQMRTFTQQARPLWSAPELGVPTEDGVLHRAWKRRDDLGLLDPGTVVCAPFQLFSRNVVFEASGPLPSIRLDRAIGFDLGLRAALDHAARKLRAKGVTW